MGLGISFGSSSKKEKGTQERDQTLTGTTSTTGQTWGTGGTQSSFWTPDQQNLASKLSGYLSGNWGATPQQQTGIDALTRAATGQGYGSIVDPTRANELYASIEKQTLEDILPKATRAIAGEANLAGMLRSGPAMQMQLESRNQIVNQLMQTLAGLKYQDEQQRRQIEQEREGRQASAGQALFANDPNQQAIGNIMQLLGIRGATTEATQQQSSQQSTENIARILNELVKSKGKVSGSNAGFSLGLG